MAVPWCAHVKIPSGFFGWRAGRDPLPDNTDCVKISGPPTGMQHTRAFVQSSLHLDNRGVKGSGTQSDMKHICAFVKSSLHLDTYIGLVGRERLSRARVLNRVCSIFVRLCSFRCISTLRKEF